MPLLQHRSRGVHRRPGGGGRERRCSRGTPRSSTNVGQWLLVVLTIGIAYIVYWLKSLSIDLRDHQSAHPHRARPVLEDSRRTSSCFASTTSTCTSRSGCGSSATASFTSARPIPTSQTVFIMAFPASSSSRTRCASARSGSARGDASPRSSTRRRSAWHPSPDLVVIHEHPEWQKPLFDGARAAGRRLCAVRPEAGGVQQHRTAGGAALLQPGEPQRLRSRQHARGAVGTGVHEDARAIGRTRAERRRRVRPRVEQERTSHAAAHARASTRRGRSPSTTSNALQPYADQIRWPAILKPDQGGSGARIQVVESLTEVAAIFAADPTIWLPDNLFLLQEYLPHDPDQGIVRLEFLGRRTALRDAREDPRPLQSVSVAGLQS